MESGGLTEKLWTHVHCVEGHDHVPGERDDVRLCCRNVVCNGSRHGRPPGTAADALVHIDVDVDGQTRMSVNRDDKNRGAKLRWDRVRRTMTIRPEPRFVCLPRFLVPSVKMT